MFVDGICAVYLHPQRQIRLGHLSALARLLEHLPSANIPAGYPSAISSKKWTITYTGITGFGVPAIGYSSGFGLITGLTFEQSDTKRQRNRNLAQVRGDDLLLIGRGATNWRIPGPWVRND